MEQRLKDLLPIMRRLQHLHELSPEHTAMINNKPRVVNFKAKESNNEPTRR
ncbi:hypothetical protein D3C81_582300 [compost metagenome]